MSASQRGVLILSSYVSRIQYGPMMPPVKSGGRAGVPLRRPVVSATGPSTAFVHPVLCAASNCLSQSLLQCAVEYAGLEACLWVSSAGPVDGAPGYETINIIDIRHRFDRLHEDDNCKRRTTFRHGTRLFTSRLPQYATWHRESSGCRQPATDRLSPPYPTTPTAELLLDSQSSLAPPRVFGNYKSVPSPRSSTTPPSTLAFAPGILPSASQKFATSPLLLRLTDCYCQRVRVFTDQGSELRQPTMNDAVRVMRSRLKHLFRLLRGTLPPRPVEDATARVCLQLRRRDRDHELFHLAGYEKPVSSDGDSPRQIHVLFLVACPGESSGHRAVPEIVARVVAQEAKGKALRVDHVAERYEDD